MLSRFAICNRGSGANILPITYGALLLSLTRYGLVPMDSRLYEGGLRLMETGLTNVAARGEVGTGPVRADRNSVSSGGGANGS